MSKASEDLEVLESVVAGLHHSSVCATVGNVGPVGPCDCYVARSHAALEHLRRERDEVRMVLGDLLHDREASWVLEVMKHRGELLGMLVATARSHGNSRTWLRLARIVGGPDEMQRQVDAAHDEALRELQELEVRQRHQQTVGAVKGVLERLEEGHAERVREFIGRLMDRLSHTHGLPRIETVPEVLEHTAGEPRLETIVSFDAAQWRISTFMRAGKIVSEEEAIPSIWGPSPFRNIPSPPKEPKP